MMTTSPKDGSIKRRRVVALFWAIFVAALCVLILNADPPGLSASPLNAPPPALKTISPTRAYNYQATTVAITGANFATPTVMLGNTPLNVTFVDSTTLTATVPIGLLGGTYTLTVTNSGGQSASLADAFTVLLGRGSLGPWRYTTSLTTVRARVGVVAAGGYIYVLGGQGLGIDNYVLSLVERAAINADGSLGLWETMAPMNTPRSDLVAVVVDSYLYVIGGNGSSGTLSSVERTVINADGSLGPWETMTPMNTPRGALAAGAAGGYLYALGGQDFDTYSSVERAVINADGSLGLWETTTPMNVPRYLFSAATAGGYLYAIGGVNYQLLSSVERAAINADGSLGPWQDATSMTTERGGLAAVAADGYLYALGGCNIGPPYKLSSVERAIIHLDGSLGSWQTTTSMNTERDILGAVAVGGYLYALGGDSLDQRLSSVEYASILYNTVYLPLVLKDSF